MALQIWDFWFCLFFVYFNECHRGAADSSWSRLKKQNIIFFSSKFHLHCICSVTLHEELSFRNEETTLPKEGKADNGLRLGMIKHLPLKKIKLCNKTFPNISYTSTHISVPSNRRALALCKSVFYFLLMSLCNFPSNLTWGNRCFWRRDIATLPGGCRAFLHHSDVAVISTGYLHILAEVLGVC